MEIDKTKDISSLLSFFDDKKYDHQIVSDVIHKVLGVVGQRLSDNQAGCAWVILLLYKRGDCTTLQIDDIIEEFIEYMKGLDEYVNSIVDGNKDDLSLTYYNGFLHKKIKGS